MASAIHVGLGYPESVSAKKDLLLSEESLLKIVQHVKNYDSLKIKECNIKNRIKKDLASIRNDILAIESHFPKEDELKRFEKKEPKVHVMHTSKKVVEPLKIKESPAKKKDRKSAIESEMEDIKEKLAQLDSL